MRDIDYIIKYVLESDHIRGPIMKQVIVNRLDPAPTEEEMERARRDYERKS